MEQAEVHDKHKEITEKITDYENKEKLLNIKNQRFEPLKFTIS